MMYCKIIEHTEKSMGRTGLRKLVAGLVSALSAVLLACSWTVSSSSSGGGTEEGTGTEVSSSFITDAAALEQLRARVVSDTALNTIAPKLISTWDYAEAHYFKTLTVDGVTCIFITDPSVSSNKGVSEAIGFWRRIAPLMARIDPTRAAMYEDRFNKLGNALRALITLAQDSGNAGNMAAWAYDVTGGVLSLDTTKSGPANSASDPDVDNIEGLLASIENVASGLFSGSGYTAELLAYAPNTKVLFELKNGVYVMRMSEDQDISWGNRYGGDYGRIATAERLARFYEAQSNAAEAAFWHAVAKGMLLQYFEMLSDLGEVYSLVSIDAGTAYTNDLEVGPVEYQGYNILRAPMNIAAGLGYFIPNGGQQKVFSAYRRVWQDTDGSDATYKRFMALMEVPFALSIGDELLARQLISEASPLFSGTTVYTDADRYFQNSLGMLVLLQTLMPYQQDGKVTMAERTYPFKAVVNGRTYVVPASALADDGE